MLSLQGYVTFIGYVWQLHVSLSLFYGVLDLRKVLRLPLESDWSEIIHHSETDQIQKSKNDQTMEAEDPP
ncbi:hypothetical protein GCM10010916_04700 [Paenibacillus abyssi]|uniref:Uncharacterized protein n=1 Tax=Paenibacillus abyssi TaxID=1340531 RepID=A0A917FMS8_9BACL|nr:hypothetical protein GCM10010916_04700 [Paenibacillus abyssi]